MKCFKYMIMLIFIILLTACGIFGNTYSDNIKNFNKVEIEGIIDKISKKDEFVLYLGRETCSYCVDFVPILNKVAQAENVEIFYVDTENTSSDPELEKFRGDYGINYVPSLLLFENEEVKYLEFPTTEKAVIDFLNS